MHAALYISKTGLAAQDRQLSTISNNLANVSTIGFKRDRATFEDLLYQIKRQPGAQSTADTQLPSGLQIGSGVRVVSTQKEFAEGNLQVTEQELDIAIIGRGFLQVEMPDGTISYTRNGQLHLNSEGTLVNASGLTISPAISVPDGATGFSIGRDGTVSVRVAGTATPQQIGSLELVDFINPAGLQAIGANQFLETAASGNPQAGTPGQNGLGEFMQGALENSNVDIVEEMVNLITTQRAYELNSKVVTSADQMLQFVTQNL
ncbi:flagellar basal-body rod protein FlgG [Aurantivibrio plasticivorans]